MYSVPANSASNKMKIDFLRPELAQGIFVNFNILKQYLKREPPFGISVVGRSYRKEISPKMFTRMRSFTQAEIEYFVDPQHKIHNNYHQIKDKIIPILSSGMQARGEQLKMIKIDDAIKQKIISSEILGYFIGKIYLFALSMGLKEHKIRFRQHLPQEMAHYASECWDLETYVNEEWIECVGLADRGSYDLECHSKNKNNKLVAIRKLKNPIKNKILKIEVNKKLIGQRYKELTSQIVEYFNNFNNKDFSTLQKFKTTMEKKNSLYISVDGLMCVITKDMIKFVDSVEVTAHETYFPHVIEPSFGIDRLIYSILEHCYWKREEDTRRSVLSIPYSIAPYNIAIFQLSNKKELLDTMYKIKDMLKDKYSCFIDTSNTNIGKRYVRADEIGIKFTITVDFESKKDNKVTIRNRDSKKQVRIDIDKLKDIDFSVYEVTTE